MLAIAVGIFAFGSVFITQDILISEMTKQYRAIDPSTVDLHINSFDDSLVRWAQRQDEVAEAQARAVYVVKALLGDKTYNLILYAAEDYNDIPINRFTLEVGKLPTGRGEFVLERTSLSLAGARVGDRLLVETPDGRTHEFSIVGSAHDLNATPANMFPELSGYISMKTLGWLGLPATFNRLELVTQPQYDTLPKLEKVADELKTRLQHNGVAVNSTAVRKPGAHWAADITQSFTIILSFVGLLSLLLSGFLVINTISALLTEQRRQIGVMKAVGGTGKQIIGIYLVLVVCYGLLALAVALPVGMLLAYMFTLSVVQFLNINLTNFHLPGQVLVMQVVAALVVPVIASAVPILGGVRVTVREAISNRGISSRGSGLFTGLLLRLRGLPRPMLLSMRNTFRRKGRLLLTLGTLALAGTLFITVVNVRSSLMAELDNIMRIVFNYEVVLALDGKYQSAGVEHRVESVPGVTLAEGRTSVQAQRFKADGTRGATFGVTGLPPGSKFFQATMLTGRWLEKRDRNAIVLSSSLAEDMPDVAVGATIVLEINGEKHEWQVVGTVLMAFDKSAYASFDYLSALIGESGLASEIQVGLERKDTQSQDEMTRVLEKRLKESGVRVVASMTKDTIVSANASQFDFLVAFLLAMAGMAGLIGALGLAGMMSLNVVERTREIGVMRSIGASNGMIGGIVLTEGLFIGIISWALAVPLSLPMSLAFNALLGDLFVDKPLVFTFSLLGVIGWLAIVVLISAMASLLPAYRAMRMSVRETLAYE